MKKYLPLILKILIVCVVLSLIILAIFIYGKKQNKVVSPNRKQNNEIRQISKEELIANYKSGVLSALNSFDNNYEETRNKLADLAVPGDFRDLHFNLIIAFDSIVFKHDTTSALEKFEKISESNDWLKQPLEKVIQSIK